jgi:hypothetical protein
MGLSPIHLEITFPTGEYYGRFDFGKLQDYSVLTILKREAGIFKLVYMHQFHLKNLEEIRNQGVGCVESLKFTVQTKEELLTNLKMIMERNRLALSYHRLLCQQINEQQYQYSKSGHLKFSHPENSDDDMLWSLALAAYAARQPKKEQAFTFD